MRCVCTTPSQMPRKSPYYVVAGFDYYDGWKECIVRCTQCGTDYYVKTLWTDDSNDDLGDIRVFTLANLPSGAVATLLRDVDELKRKGIVPWSALDNRLSELLESLSPEILVAARGIDREVFGVKPYPQLGLPTFDDLGIPRVGPIS